MEQLQYNEAFLLNEASHKEQSKMYYEAVELYECAINKNIKNYCAYLSLGALYEKLNNTEKAKDVYLKGISTARANNDKEAETDFSFTLLGLMELTL